MKNILPVMGLCAILAISALADCPTGDLSGDCQVTWLDLQIFARHWLELAGSAANINGDDKVNLIDFAYLSKEWHQKSVPQVVINEIHFDPDLKTELVEYIELYNAGVIDVNISGWHFCDGVSYEFPPGTILPAGGYFIVVQNVEEVIEKWGYGRVAIDPALVFGPYDGKLSNEGEKIELRNADGNEIDQVDYQLGFPWPTVGDAVPQDNPGSGHSIQLINPFFDNDIAGSWRSSYPTPTKQNNAVFSDNTAPHIRQVKHTPRQPKSGEVVTITAKVTDPDGVCSVLLQYQLVNPGNYTSLNDTAYRSDWTSIPMHDDGFGGDETAGDDIYTVQIPASLQTHRRLVRYRIRIEDNCGLSLTVPYADDPQPNFAYFVYDGVPAWYGAIQPGVTPVIGFGPDGAIQPGVTPVIGFGPEIMRSIPVYHLISKKSDVEACTWFEQYGGSDYKWYGTLVYEDQVYDHIRYRARGGVWRYAMGKNMWKFNFNRGHRFQGRDDYGNKYDTKWDKLNFSACIQQGYFGQRGEQGMFEALTNRLFNMAGVPASKTNWVHFRIIDEPYEDGTLNAAHPPLTSSGTQYDGDFWGLYMTLEQMDGRFLDEHGLPDGNLYKMDQAYPDGCKLNNQGPTGVTDKSDVLNFRATYQSSPGAEWWGQNVNLESYYSYRAIYHATHHGDITSKNHFFYLNPEPTTNDWGTNNLWWQLPWDVDLTWTTYYGSMSDPFSRSNVLSHEVISIAAANRVREICDLLFNPEQMNQLIDELAGIISDPEGGLSIVDADRAMWDYHWVMTDAACSAGYRNRCGSNRAGQDRFYKEAEERGYERSFAGMVQVMKDFVVERQSHMRSLCSDSAIPDTPVVRATCPPTFPINALTFETTAFSDPQGSGSFAAMEWRIAEVAAGSQATPPDEGIVLISEGTQWKYFKGTAEPSAQGLWRQLNFNDSSWLQGEMPIGYGEGFIATVLGDMRGGYTTVYLRKKFDVSNLDDIETLVLEVMYDDGVNVWINENHVCGANVSAAELPYNATANSAIENHNFVRFVLTNHADYLSSGTNIIAIQLLNASLSGSSDCFIDVRLIGELADPCSPAPYYSKKPGKYEIDAVWESGEITDFNSTIRIPASVVRPGRTYRVRCRMKDNTGRWSHWSDPNQFVAGEPLAAGVVANLRVTELMYNPADPPPGNPADNDDFEFVELKNIGDEVIDLSYVSFVDGISFDFNEGSITSLGPGEFVLVVKDRAAFVSRYGAALSGIIAGEYSGRLANEGENVKLMDFWNGVIAEFEYNDGRGWPLAADGAGHSLVPVEAALLGQPEGSLNYGANWRASAYIGGSPGQDDPEVAATVVINEFMAHTDFNDPAYPDHDSNDWIELYNSSAANINLDNWYLSDDVDELKKWAIPAVVVAGYGYISFDEVSDFHNPITAGFGLNKAGEQIILSYLPGTQQGGVVDCIRFKGQENDISLGRWPDGGAYWYQMTPSRGSANGNLPLHVVIDELMYHPVDVNEEYLELYNPTAGAVLLESAGGPWRLDGGVDYVFPTGLSIPAGGRLIVVGFDPVVEMSRLNAFIAAYHTGPLTAGVEIVGPWSGRLSNRGERVAVERPEPPDQAGDPIVWVIEDEVIYADVAPWPEGPDGDGDALQRVYADRWHCGNDPANWQAAAPSPGSNP